MSKIRPMIWGLALSVIALISSFSAGMYMGVFEDSIRAGWKAGAKAGTDPTQLQTLLDIAWTCLIRTHLHWGALGAASLGMSCIFMLVKVPDWYKRIASILLGLGAIIYPLAWLYVANHLVAIGGETAKANAHWIAVIGISCMMLGTLAVLASLVIHYINDKKSLSQDVKAA